MKINYKRPFAHFVKKANKPFQLAGSHENFYTELKRFLRQEAVLRQSEEEEK
jgi:hypothetical protein